MNWRWSLLLLVLPAAAPGAAAPLYPFQTLSPVLMPMGDVNLRVGASYASRDHLNFQEEDKQRRVAELPSIRLAVAVGTNAELHFSYPLLYLNQEGQDDYGSGDVLISGLLLHSG